MLIISLMLNLTQVDGGFFKNIFREFEQTVEHFENQFENISIIFYPYSYLVINYKILKNITLVSTARHGIYGRREAAYVFYVAKTEIRAQFTVGQYGCQRIADTYQNQQNTRS